MAKCHSTAICEICHQEFPKRSGKSMTNRFCSRSCYLVHHANERKIEYVCLACNKPFLVNPCREKEGVKYCSASCCNKHKRPPARKCRQCGYRFTPVHFRKIKNNLHLVVKNDRVICSTKCLRQFYRTNEVRKQKISIAFTGAKHPNWQGGKRQRYQDARGPGWKRLAEKIRARQKYLCARCGKHESENDRKLDVNHIEPWHNFTDHRKANVLSNLEALCHSCHMLSEQRTNLQISFAFVPGKKGYLRGEKAPRARFTNAQVRLMRQWYKDGVSNGEIGKRLGASTVNVWQITTGKTYKGI